MITRLYHLPKKEGDTGKLPVLLIEQLPVYIQKINEEKNDGIIIKEFYNLKLNEDCKRLPSFSMKMDEAEYNEKDRIIGNTVFAVGIEINLEKDYENKTIELWRYERAIERLINEYEGKNWIYLEVTGVKENTISLEITCEK